MQTLEQIAYDAGRRALTDQETFVSGIPQRAGTSDPSRSAGTGGRAGFDASRLRKGGVTLRV